MEWIAAIQQAITYMEAHLLEELRYEIVTKQVHISSYEFHRAFSFLTGMTVSTYIRNRRLSLAGRAIVETDEKITDIALKYGYETPESFTKAFTRFHGVSPMSARKESAKLQLFNPLVIKLTVEGGKSMDYRIAETKEQQFVALVRNFRNEIINDDENHEIPDFWTECQEKNLIERIRNLRPAGKRDLYGLCTPTRAGQDTFAYGIGVLVDAETTSFSAGELEQAGYTIWNVKPGTYVVFECIGEDGDCIGETWARFFKEFLPQMGYEVESETDYEVYYEKARENLFCELWIPIRRRA